MIRKKLTALIIALAVAISNLPLANVNAAGFEKRPENLQSQDLDLNSIKAEAERIYLENQKSTTEKNDLYTETEEATTYSKHDKVRIIVKLKEESGITSYATSQNNYSIQQKTITDIKSENINFEVRHQFSDGANAITGEIKYGDMETLENLPNVESVRIAKEYTPYLSGSNALIQSQKVWEYLGYKGEGMVVAVLDTGFDVTHQDFKLSHEGEAYVKLSNENLKDKLSATEVDDIYYNSKIPTGYDWANMDNDISPLDPYYAAHGMHVAGIVGANGDTENGGVVGIAPEAQIIGEKVFSDDGSGYEDDIIAGIDHAVKMGADVINMSLGSDCGFVLEDEDLMQIAIKNAAEQGVLVVISAGNASFSTDDAYYQRPYPYKDNYDIGTVGDPSVTSYALSVASFNNNQTTANIAELSNGLKVPYLNQIRTYPNIDEIVGDGEFEVVKVDGYTSKDLENLNLENKVVVLEVKNNYDINPSLQKRFQQKGAIAVLLTNGYTYNYNTMSNSTPLIAISKESGADIVEALTTTPDLKIKFTAKTTLVSTLDGITASNFSSWGTTPTLDFKPEIAGVGGNIYSTTPDGGHTHMSGTSMSSPQVAGAAAILLQSMKSKGEELDFNTIMKAKNILMNNTTVVEDTTIIEDEGTEALQVDAPYSPRKQGSGLLQLANAIETPLIAYDTNADIQKRGAFALKEINDNTTLSLGLEPLKELSTGYDIFVDLYTDMSRESGIDINLNGEIDYTKEINLMHSKEINNANIKINGQILNNTIGYTVDNLNSLQTLSIELDLSASDVEENSFIEGYIRIVPKDSTYSDVNVPLMGFYGDWNAASNIDEPMVNGEPFSEYTAVFPYDTDVPLGYNYNTREIEEEKVAFSAKAYGMAVGLRLTVLRNLEYLKVDVVDKDGNVVRNMDGFDYLRKNTFNNRNIFVDLANYDPWDGTDNDGNMLPDGTYFFAAKSKFSYEGSEEQVTKFQIKLDNTAPTISNITINEVDGRYEINFNPEDPVSGYNGSIIYVDNDYISLKPGETSYFVESKPEQVVVIAFDNAGNAGLGVYGSSIVDKEMLLLYFMAYGEEVNFESPFNINGASQLPINWNLSISGPTGAELYEMVIEDESFLYTGFLPEQGEPNGTYLLSGYIEDAKTGIRAYLDDYEFYVMNNEIYDKSLLFDEIMASKDFLTTIVVGDEVGQYTEDVVMLFEDIIYESETVYYEPTSTEDQINLATEAIKTGLKDLLSAINPSEGKKSAFSLLESCEETINNAIVGDRPGNYPQEAIDALKSAMKPLQDLVNSDEEVSDKDFYAAIEELNKAINLFNGTVIPAGNVEEITALLASQRAYIQSIEAGTCKDKYSEPSVIQYKNTLNEIELAISNPLTESEAEALTTEFKDNVNYFLNTKINTAYLETAIKEGKEFLASIDAEKNLYSEAAIASLRTEIISGEEILAGSYTTEGAVGDAARSILNAIKSVKDSKDNGENPVDPDPNPENPDPEDPNGEIIALTGITLNKDKATLKIGETLDLKVTFNPEDATNKNVTWGSSNTTIAKVEKGKVTALKAGTAVIKVASDDGKFTTECTITVKSVSKPPLPQTGGVAGASGMLALGVSIVGLGLVSVKKKD